MKFENFGGMDRERRTVNRSQKRDRPECNESKDADPKPSKKVLVTRKLQKLLVGAGLPEIQKEPDWEVHTRKSEKRQCYGLWTQEDACKALDMYFQGNNPHAETTRRTIPETRHPTLTATRDGRKKQGKDEELRNDF